MFCEYQSFPEGSAATGLMGTAQPDLSHNVASIGSDILFISSQIGYEICSSVHLHSAHVWQPVHIFFHSNFALA